MNVVTIEINGIKKELKRNDVIHCNTIEKAKKLLTALKENGIKWCSGDGLDKNYYNTYDLNTCYCLGDYGLEFSPVDFYTENSNYCVYNFDELFTEKFTIDELYDVIKAVVCWDNEKSMSPDDLLECFGIRGGIQMVIGNNTSQSLVEKYRKWKESKENEIKVGDIFEALKNPDYKFIIIKEKDEDEEFKILDSDYDTIYIREDTILNLNYKKIGHKENLDLF